MIKLKTMSLRLPKETWAFLKYKSIEREMSVNEIIVERLNKYKKKNERSNNMLTRSDTVVS